MLSLTVYTFILFYFIFVRARSSCVMVRREIVAFERRKIMTHTIYHIKTYYLGSFLD